MDVARHVIQTFLTDIPDPLVRHHLDSFADLLNTKLHKFIEGSNPQRLVIDDARTIDVSITNLTYHPPREEDGSITLPHSCRLENKTYALEVRATLTIEYRLAEKTLTQSFPNMLVGKLPLMIKSNLCVLSSLDEAGLDSVGECKYELGGYFIISGAEKVLLSQERLGDNIPYATKRVQRPSSSGKRGLTEKEDASKLEDATKAEKFEYISGIRSVSEDGTTGPYSHFCVIPPANRMPGKDISLEESDTYATHRLAIITLPGFTQAVPLWSVFRLLGCVSDADVYDTILAGIPASERTDYDDLFTQLLMSHQTYIKQEMQKEKDEVADPDLLFLRRQTRTRSPGAVFVNLYTNLFPHCEHLPSESNASLFRRKSYILGKLVRMAMDVCLEKKSKSDRDHFRFKRLDASGDLCFQMFRKIYKDVAKGMLTKIDSRIHFEPQTYAGDKIANVVQPETLSYYWNAKTFLNVFEKSFKGQWDGKDGVSQELSRLSYLGTAAHLRRVNLQMDKTTKTIEPRRIHGSTWGLMCPADNPDGGNIGMIKSMALFCSISTASPSESILKLLRTQPNFTPVHLIHPSTWNPQWTPIFLNYDLVGVYSTDTERLHSTLMSKRRDGAIPFNVSLCWDRSHNEYIVFTDAGRPIRPVYRENTRAESIRTTRSWKDIRAHLDFIDSQETESVRISMTPFATTLSEIHGSVVFSASASVIPHPDFNQAPRNFFSCQQTKQSCSIFSTAFSKRFDTIATLLNYAQRPISQTWTYEPILHNLAYGENAIVALMIYSGYNQEDSILLNDSALRRGLFHTTYYHSYDIMEEMVDPASLTHTSFANVATDPKYRETIERKVDYSYDFLDSDGLIQKGSPVNDKTILVGILSGDKDVSYTPKRGQEGIVDDVYRYTTSEGLRAVKIRVAEHRIPTLGDKFASRSGQKGTGGFRVPEQDMPFTAKGVRPDMIVNPHAIPSRMTIGHLVESMSAKLGLHMGTLVDSTAFTSQNRVQEIRSLLDKAGLHPYGHEIMYNGMTGEMFPVEIFMGPIYYLRLKHMVADKINYTTRGPRKLLTHQPVDGRANEGGLRIGEMERDALVSHGVSKFLHESLMDRSDGAEVAFDPESGRFDAREHTETTLSVPYAMKVFAQELESMHISVKLEIS